MIRKFFQNLWAKEEIESLPFVHENKITLLLLAIVLLLPTQFGKHFWPLFSFISGQRVDYLSPTLYFTDILIFILFLCYVIKKKKISINPLFFIILLVLILETFFIKQSLLSWYGILKLCEVSFFAFSIKQFVKKSGALSFIAPLSLGVVFESVLAILQFFHHGSINGIMYFFGERFFTSTTPGIANATIAGQLILRPYGTFSHPNVLAGYLLIAMTIILFARKAGKTKRDLLFYVTILTGTAALLLSLSRVAILLWIIVLLFQFAHSVRIFSRRSSTRSRMTILFFSTFIIIFLAFSPLLLGRYAAIFTDTSFAERMYLYKVAINSIFSYPLFGTGLYSFPVSVSHYNLQPVHNIFLLFFSETGILGSASIFLFLYTLFKNSFKKTMLSYLLVFLVVCLGMTDHYFLTLQQGQLLLGLILGTIIQ